jgi:hypothetical protein
MASRSALLLSMRFSIFCKTRKHGNVATRVAVRPPSAVVTIERFLSTLGILKALIGCVERLHSGARPSNADVDLKEEYVAGVLQVKRCRDSATYK